MLDVDKDFEHDVAVQGVLMAQVGWHWWLSRAIRATLALSLHLCSVFHGKNNFHTVGPRWFKPQLSQGHPGATLAQSWCATPVHSYTIPVPSQGHLDATPVHSHTIPVPSQCHPGAILVQSLHHPIATPSGRLSLQVEAFVTSLSADTLPSHPNPLRAGEGAASP